MTYPNPLHKGDHLAENSVKWLSLLVGTP